MDMDPDRTVVPVFGQGNLAAPSALHPFLPMKDILFLGAKRGGKSTLMLNMIVRMLYFTSFAVIYFISPHVRPDLIDKNDYGILKGLKNVRLYWELTEKAYEDAAAYAKAHPELGEGSCLMAIDDFAAKLKKKTCAFVTERFANLRHTEKCVMW
jgi:hypothetical protein